MQFQPPPQQPNYTQPQAYYPPPQPVSMPGMPPQYPPPQKPPGPLVPAQDFRVIIGVIVAIISVVSIALASHGTFTSSTPSGTTQSSTTGDQTTTTQQQTTTYTTGNVATSGVWQVTLNSARTLASDGPDHAPKAGNAFLMLNVTLRNADTGNQRASSFAMFALRDTQGTTYSETILLNATSPDGAVVANQQIRGDIAYEVPSTVHQFVLQFQPTFDSLQIVQWNITV